MAIGFTPKYIVELSLNDLTHEQYLTIATETATEVGWEIVYLSQTGFIAHTNKGMFAWNADITLKIEDGIVIIKSESAGNDMFDWGKNKKTINNFLQHFEHLKTSVNHDEIQQKYKLLLEKFTSGEEDLLLLPPPTAKDNLNGFLSLFRPQEHYFFTPILVNINILIFIIMAIGGMNILLPDNETLLIWGANFRPYTLEGQWWRLLTNCFLHIGIIHLLFNMYALVYIGILLEPHLGRVRFLMAYMLTGIAASVTSLWWHDMTISAGASGAIFGLYGVFLAMLTTNLIEKAARKALLTSIGIFVVYNLAFGLKGGIDNAAHIGGLVSGLILGYIFYPSLSKSDNKRISVVSITLSIILVVSFSVFVYHNLPNDLGQYQKKMETFSALEKQALEIYSINENTTIDVALKEIQEKGIHNWKENLLIVNEISEMELSSEILERNVKLKKYADLRLKACELIYKMMSEQTKKYNEQLLECNTQIEAQLNELNKESK